MSCGCKNNIQVKSTLLQTDPKQQCILCAQKHFCTALVLLNQRGYQFINVPTINSQIINSQKDIYKYNFQLAKQLRDLRHLVIQHKQISKQLLASIAKQFDIMINKESNIQPIDRDFIIGQLNCLNMHIRDKNIIQKIRILRHKIQNREKINIEQLNQIFSVFNVFLTQQNHQKNKDV